MKSWVVISALISTALAVELSVRSNCPETVWLATQPNSDQGPLPDGVISLAPGASYTYQVSKERQNIVNERLLPSEV